jgi:hypothetical protein
MEHSTPLVHLFSGCHCLKGVTLEKRLESPFRYDSIIIVSSMSQEHERSSDFIDCDVFRTAQSRVRKKRRVAQQIKKFHLDPEGVIPCSQEFAFRIRSEPFVTGPQHHGVFLKIRFSTVRLSTRQPCKWVFFHQVFQ